ncbi:MAG TPA: hypothetical protein VHL11_01330, partial [Phototrophicaceae bacterium]|nr:hypothetical protein [Phototrophicaceae bacterium]
MTIDFISTFHQPTGSYFSDTLRTLRLTNDIRLEMVNWSDLWARLKTSVYDRRGNEIAEIGTTWVASLMAMDALSSFNNHELLQIGQASDFIAPA